jgi:membrane protein
MDANNAVVDLARRVKDEMAGNNLTLVAAGVAFYSLLAVFPAIIGVVTVYALVSSPSQVEGQIRPLLTALPPDAAALLLNRLTLAVEANGGGLTVGLVVSLVATVWAATGGVSALMTGLNIISGVPEGRNFIKLRGLALGLTFGALVGAAVALGLVAAFPVVLDRIGLDPAAAIGAQAARWVTLVAVVLLGLSVLYRWGPDRQDARWRPISVGSVVALGVWMLASVGFSLYVSNFGSYNKTYGSLAAVVVLLMWLYLSAFAILLGAQVDAVRAAEATEAEHRRAYAAGARATALAGASDTVLDADSAAEPVMSPAEPAMSTAGRHRRATDADPAE